MDAAFRTPLVDIFRRGEVDRDVRLLAARGALAPRAHEQVALLMLLVEDPDREVAATAEGTLAMLPVSALGAFLARSDVGGEVREFFARRGIAPAAQPAPSCSEPLLEPREAPQPSDELSGQVGEPPVGNAVEAPRPEGAEVPAGEEESVRRGAAQRLALLTVAERMKVALQGSREERSILIRDPNRLVSASVLSSPKLTESEVEAIARMTNVSDDVLRTLGTTRTWVKNYNVLSALARNPKTPIAISLGLLSRLNERDIKMLSTDRNIPEPVRVASRKMYVHNQTRRQ
jgi:hypothetical protein